MGRGEVLKHQEKMTLATSRSSVQDSNNDRQHDRARRFTVMTSRSLDQTNCREPTRDTLDQLGLCS